MNIELTLSTTNLLLSVALAVYSGITIVQERRSGYKWIWMALIGLGTIWSILFLMGILNLSIIPSDLLNNTVIRAAITVTLGVLLGMALQLRGPRCK